jgi:hypothetical protein
MPLVVGAGDTVSGCGDTPLGTRHWGHTTKTALWSPRDTESGPRRGHAPGMVGDGGHSIGVQCGDTRDGDTRAAGGRSGGIHGKCDAHRGTRSRDGTRRRGHTTWAPGGHAPGTHHWARAICREHSIAVRSTVGGAAPLMTLVVGDGYTASECGTRHWGHTTGDTPPGTHHRGHTTGDTPLGTHHRGHTNQGHTTGDTPPGTRHRGTPPGTHHWGTPPGTHHWGHAPGTHHFGRAICGGHSIAVRSILGGHHRCRWWLVTGDTASECSAGTHAPGTHAPGTHALGTHTPRGTHTPLGTHTPRGAAAAGSTASAMRTGGRVAVTSDTDTLL